MKRIISIVMSAVIILSALCLVSCDEKATPIDSINGMSAKEACELGFERLGEKETYHVSVDAELRLNLLVASIPVGIDEFYVNTTDGEDMHYKFTDKDLLFIDNAKLLSIFSGYDKEVWYVDGVRYSVNTEGEKVVDDSGNRQPSNVVEKIVNTITEEELNTALAYTKDGETYVLVTMNIEEFGIGVVTCKIFLDGSGRLSSVILDGNLYTFGAVVALNFEYDSVDKVAAPTDFLPVSADN